MNAKTEDKFSALMSTRVMPLVIDGLPPLEIREQPLGVIKPLLDRMGDMDGNEFTHRLIGFSIYLDGEQLTYERVQNMTVGTLQKFLPALPQILRVYGLAAEADKLQETTEFGADSKAAPNVAGETETAPTGVEPDKAEATPGSTTAMPDDDDEDGKPKRKKG